MSSSSWRAEGLLLRRLFVGRRLLPSLAIPLAIGLVFTATYWVANAFALSGPQLAERDLGQFEHAIMLDAEPGDLDQSSMARLDAHVLTLGMDAFGSEIVSNDVVPDQLATRASSGPQRVTRFVQMAGPGPDSAAAYRLVSGQWPTAPGDVLVTPALRTQLNEDRFTAFAGGVPFRVVGTVEDRFDTEAIAMVAAPGTWESIPESAAKAFAPEAIVRIMWSGNSPPATVESSVRAALALAPPPEGSRPATERANLIRDREKSLSEDQRLLFAYPLMLLSAMAGVSVVRSNRRWTHAYLNRCRDLGLNPSRVGLVLLAVVTSGVVIAVTGGVIVGSLAGTALRRWVLPEILTHPPGPTQSLSPVITAAVVMAGVSLIACAVDLVVPGERRLKVTSLSRRVPWTLLRRVIALVVVAKGIQAASRTALEFDDLSGTGVLITAAGVLLAPDLLRLGRLCLTQRRPRSLVARRMIDADRGGLALVSMVVAASVAFPTTVSSYNATARHSNDVAFTGTVRPHQLWVDGNLTSDPQPIATAVATAVPGTRPIDLRWTDAFVYPQGGTPSENTGIAAIPRGEDVRAILGDEPWVRDMADYISTGGTAFIEGPLRPMHSRASDGKGTIDLPTRLFDHEQDGLAAPFAGVMLVATAEDIGLDTVHMATIFADLDQPEIDSGVAAVRDAGLDIRALNFYSPPPHTPPTPQSYFALGALLVLASFLLLGLMRAVGERMRERAGQLLAVGFRRRWSGSVAALQLGLSVMAGLVAGVLGSAAAIWIFVSAPAQSMVLSIPMGFITLTVAMVVLVAGAGIGICLARVRARPEANL